MTPAHVLRLAVCVLITGATLSFQTKPDSEAPRWSKDLVPDLGRNPAGTYNLSGVAFLDDRRLLVHVVSRDLSRLSSRESPEVSSTFRLRAWVIDANSGEMEGLKEWGTRPYNSEVWVTSGGVLVKTGGILKLYSPDFAQARDLPLALDPNGSYFVSVSTSGQTIVISHYLRKEQNYVTHIDVLDARTLKIRGSWDQYPPIFRFSMSDKGFATVRDGVVAMTELGSAERSKVVTVSAALKRSCAAGGAGPRVVSDDLIVLRGCKEVLLVTSAGASISLDTFNGDGSPAASGSRCKPYNTETSGKVAVASDGARFVALALPALKIKKPVLGERRTCLDGLWVAVYDLTLKKRILAVNVDPLPENNYDFALSPDGSTLAILSDRKVSVYPVPVQPSQQR